MKKGLVSIITPMYNGSRYVAETIDSVLAQTYANWEMIVVDDCSPDEGAGANLVASFRKKDPRIKLIELDQNRGSSGARNVGIKAAEGQYICLLDSDDVWESNFLASQLEFKEKNDASLVYSSYKMMDEHGKIILKPYIVRPSVSYADLLKQNDIGCLTALYDVSKIGKFYLNEDLGSIRDDFELWLRMIKKTGLAYGNPDILARYRVMQSSTTGNKLKMIKPQWLVYRKVEKLSLWHSLYYLAHWALSGLIKYSAK